MKNSFIVQYGVHLWLASMGLTGIWGSVAAFVAASVLGSMVDKGIIQIDIQIEKIKQALKDPEWKAAAAKAYAQASAKVYTEDEKNAIRQQYLDALSKYATFGQLPNDKNS